MRITVDIPDELARKVVSPDGDPARILLEDFAVESYRARKLTMEQVRELLGFSTRMQTDAFLQRHQVYDYTVEDLEKDLATLDRLLGPTSQPLQA
jgi:predicted HTH domain antitoxin